MRIIQPYIKELMFYIPESEESATQEIETVARTCYQSEGMKKEGSDRNQSGKWIKRGHHAMLEFGGGARVTIVADRGHSHEAVRHRLASFAQESTRYCNYTNDKFNGEIVAIAQPGIMKNAEALEVFDNFLEYAEWTYTKLVSLGIHKQEARAVLPIGMKSEINIAANFREWRHIFKMRCAPAAHPIIRSIMKDALYRFSRRIPVIFDDQVEEFLK